MNTLEAILSMGQSYGLTGKRTKRLVEILDYYKDENVLTAVTLILADNLNSVNNQPNQKGYLPDNRYGNLEKIDAGYSIHIGNIISNNAEIPAGPYYILLEQKLPNRQTIENFNFADWKKKTKEGQTQCDAIIFNLPEKKSDQGLLCLVEAKLLSDAGKSIKYDKVRDQISRNIELGYYLTRANGRFKNYRFFFIIITPLFFKKTKLMAYSRVIQKIQNGNINRKYSKASELENPIIHWITWEEIYNKIFKPSLPQEETTEIKDFFKARCLID